MRIILLLLPFIALGISFLSAVWGLVHELYTKDSDGKRRITKQGKYSIVFLILGLLVSFNATALKTILDNQDRAAQRNEASQRDQEKTVMELRRSNEILFSISRAQYPLTNNIRITPLLRISTNHPVLRNFADQIKISAERLVTLAKRQNSQGKKPLIQFTQGTGDDEIIVSEKSPLIPNDRLVRSLLTSLVLNVQIYANGNDLSCECGSDLAFAYTAELFDRKICCGATLTYRRSDSTFGIAGPMLKPAETEYGSSFNSNGKIISYLDLPGSTLVLSCNDERWQRSEGRLLMSVSHNCDESITLTSLKISTAQGQEIEIPGQSFERMVAEGDKVFLHRFNSDVGSFFESYGKGGGARLSIIHVPPKSQR